MATFVKGDIVVLPFLCQITSKNTKDSYTIALDNSDLVIGSLSIVSNIRPNRLFTADKKIIAYTIGRVSQDKYNEVTKAINELIKL